MRECNTTVRTWRIAIRPRSAAKVGRRAHEQENTTAASAHRLLATYPWLMAPCVSPCSEKMSGMFQRVQRRNQEELPRSKSTRYWPRWGARMGCGCGCGCGQDNRRPWRSVGRGNGNGQSRSLAVSSGHGPVYCPGWQAMGVPPPKRRSKESHEARWKGASGRKTRVVTVGRSRAGFEWVGLQRAGLQTCRRAK